MKFCGKIGFGNYVVTSPGVWEEEVVEKTYTGNFVKKYLNSKDTNDFNDELDISFSINFIPDKYFWEYFHRISYIVWKKSKWKVTSVDVTTSPRVTITCGGLYNGQD